jgi:tRNA pseudouridine55 synthase
MTASEIFGFLNVNKPAGMTSHDVVGKARRAVGMKRIGHAGTLDPLATGVLILCLGGATRLSEYVMDSTKRYRARVHLGVTTDTYDAQGAVQLERDAAHITSADVEHALTEFLGDIQQIPPMYSAIKQRGRKLYDLARAGKTVELEPRPVRIDVLTLVEWHPPEFTLDVTCSAGTYIRSLAYDLGETLGVGAHLAGLIRFASGRFTLEDAMPFEAFASGDWKSHLISPAQAFADWPTIQLNAVETDHILHGRAVQSEAATGEQLALVYDSAGVLIAMVRGGGGLWRPHKVFSRE